MKTVKITINLCLVFLILLVSSPLIPGSAHTSNPDETRTTPPPNPELVGWTNAGLYGATINKVSVDPVHDSVFMTVAGGSYMSKDGGLSWDRIAEDASGPLVTHPTSGRTYLGVWDNYADYEVWITTDGGGSWTQKGGFNSLPYTLAVDPSNPLVVFMGTSNWDNPNGGQIFRSLDGGLNWTSTVVDHNYQIVSIAVDPTNSNNVFAVSGSSGGCPDHSALFHSTNGGTSFGLVFTSPNCYEYSEVGFDKFGRLVLLGDGVRYSDDGGDTWSDEILDETIPSWDLHTLVFDPVTGDAYRQSYGCWTSSDGGAHWTSCGFPRMLAFHPTDNDIIFAANPPGLVVSVDHGVNWVKGNIGLEHVIVEHLDGETTTDVVYATTHQGFGRSTDGGATWDFPAAGGTYMLAVDPTTPGKVFADSGHSSYRVSTDFGQHWSDPSKDIAATNGQITCMQVDPRDNDVIYAGLSTLRADAGSTDTTAGLYATDDGGTTWQRVGLAEKQVYRLAAAVHDTYTYIFAGMNYDADGIFDGGVYRGVSGGTTWDLVGLSGSNINDLVVDPRNPEHILAAVGHWYPTDQPKGLYESFDSGDTWNKVTFITDPDLNATSITFDPFDPRIIYLGSGSYLFRNMNSGSGAWELLEFTEIRNIAATFIPSGSSDSRLFIGTGEGAFYRNFGTHGSFTNASGGSLLYEDGFGFSVQVIDDGGAFPQDSAIGYVDLPLQQMPGNSGFLPWRYFQLYVYQGTARYDHAIFDDTITITITIPEELRTTGSNFLFFSQDADEWNTDGIESSYYDPATRILTAEVWDGGAYGLFREEYGVYLPLIIRN